MMKVNISSSLIKTVCYDISESTLIVEYVKGSIFHFYQVPQSEYEGLLTAKSPGRFFMRRIANSHYLFNKIA